MLRKLDLLIFILAFAVATGRSAAQTPTVSTYAGGGSAGFSGDGGPAINAQLSGSLTTSIDASGNLLIVDSGNSRLRRVDSTGVIRTIAGGGSNPSGDGGPATSALVFPNSVAADSSGNLFILQGSSIRKVDTNGVITTIAGSGLPGYGGDGGPAKSAVFFATSIAIDGAGNLYISDSTNQRIRKIDTSGIITTVAGTGVQGYSGDGGPATSAKLALPQGLAVDAAGNIYFCDSATHVRKVDVSGAITTVAGNGTAIATGDGGPATSAGMTPTWAAVDSSGNLFIADTGGKRIRKVNTSGVISTYAGGALNTGTGNGDGGAATSAVFTNISCVSVDALGNVYVSDSGAARIRKVSSGVSASPVTVSPGSLSFSYTSGAATPPGQKVVITSPGASLTFTASASTTSGGNWLSVTPASGPVNNTLTISVNPAGLAAGSYMGTITIAPSGSGNTAQTVTVQLTVSPPAFQGVISTVAGNGNVPFSTAGAAAVNTALAATGIALDGSGNLYIADSVSNRVLKVGAAGTVSVLAGTGAFTFSGDGGPATSAGLFSPQGVAADSSGNVYIADSSNNRVRKVDSSGAISTFAGNGTAGVAIDGGAATSSPVVAPLGVAVDKAGNVYIADSSNFRVRKVNSAGMITTVAGGALGFSGDGGPATSAGLFLPGGVAVDAGGDLFIADLGNNRIRKVNAAGVISTYAGNGTKGYAGDGGSATSAALNLSSAHTGLAIDAAGNLYIPDPGNNRLRKVDTNGVITTIAGNGIAGFSGDGGLAVNAGLNHPGDAAVDSSGNIYVADTTNNRVRKITSGGGAAPPSISDNGIVNGASFKPGLAANSWVTLIGSGFGSATDTWANSIVNGALPTSLDGVSVTVNGKAGYIYYVSPTQINLIAPDVPAGAAQVVVSSPSGTSSTFTVAASQYGPAWFTWPNNQAVATRQDFSYAAKAGTFSGATTVPAKPGDVIILWGTGFGPTSPTAPLGMVTPSNQTYSAATAPSVTVGGAQATVYGAALAPGFAGLYQIAIQVPTTLANGDWPVIASVGGFFSDASVILSVQR